MTGNLDAVPGPAGIPLAGPRPSANPGCSLASVCLAAGADRPESDVQVTGVTLDSRTVQRGDLYAALTGARTHGADFAAGVEAAGAVALLTDDEGRGRAVRQGCTLPLVVVPDPRGVLGAVAAEVYGHPARDLQLLGVTGTNGKTTTTYLLDAVLRAAGRTTGLVGTVEIRVADQRVPSVRTTPEAPDLHGLLAAMRERGVHVCSMEVSSQALAQHRVDGAV